MIDVNVHPTKMQIKISNEEEMASVVEKLTNELLKSASMIPDIKPIEDAPKSYSKQNIFNDVILKKRFQGLKLIILVIRRILLKKMII